MLPRVPRRNKKQKKMGDTTIEINASAFKDLGDVVMAKKVARVASEIAGIHESKFSGVSMRKDPQSQFCHLISIRWSGDVGVDSSVLADIQAPDLHPWFTKWTFGPYDDNGKRLCILTMQVDNRGANLAFTGKKRKI